MPQEQLYVAAAVMQRKPSLVAKMTTHTAIIWGVSLNPDTFKEEIKNKLSVQYRDMITLDITVTTPPTWLEGYYAGLESGVPSPILQAIP